jgi:hypothetical protein
VGLDLDCDALMAHQLDAGPPVDPTTPVPPEKRRIPNGQGMQQDADLARLLGDAALPLTLLAQRTRAAIADAGRIDHTQTAIGFSTPLLGTKRLSCWTAERPIWLKRKILPPEAARFPGGGRGGWTVSRCGCG